ncbi:cysteine hydrolase family protein [Pseudoduganella ginsengisoli]|uniref:Isochorismatase family protein n=1 Tax=Pseudoduganella ginsengisoli TaxID=1462440 RepID=A0A6L6PZ10_9BURK|nr:cysteine hydrolase family protein [Pseudoduganella ginsengisoli]MTW02218.1 isochorismatase family protein [Pseudoduganella ginsengisoli]
MKTALLIIDVQQALCYGEYAAWDISRILANINTVSVKARAAGAPVFLIQHDEPGGPLQADSAGWQLADGLETAATDIRLRKQASDSFHNTDLHAQLQQRGIDRLVICGLQSDFCVDTTTRRAMAHGYPVQLVADGHSTLDNGVLTAQQIAAHHNATLSNLSSFGPRTRAVPATQVEFA